MMKKEPTERRVKDQVYQDNTAILLYSSGTTDSSKGIILSHRNLIALSQLFSSMVNPDEGEQTFTCTVPSFHLYGFGAFAIGIFMTGSKAVILSIFDMNQMLSAAENYRATVLPLVPPTLLALMKGADQMRKKCDLSWLQNIMHGGAPLSKKVMNKFMEKFPNVNIRQVYGLTETTGYCRKYGAIGLSAPTLEAKLVDPSTGLALKVNQMGEL